ncbi:hypothetical protein P608_24205 [Comamonas thiooxydans]|uniref:Uncharacterized protein n=1 Tax=Comamonas thiooxydans TaxID=363952 RepID=A0A0E3CBL1_9BURK|nr:hypothetical protein P608_24205 [Comamonas thiooxydans]KGH18746.1 hypothetical protein P607_13500 [Comamonas thiooxydans]KGH19707.1 hypothetical protein P606_22955 [Comamonas thiooxydans]
MAISGRKPGLYKRLLQIVDLVAQYSAGPRGIQDALLSARQDAITSLMRAQPGFVQAQGITVPSTMCVEPKKALHKALYRSKRI